LQARGSLVATEHGGLALGGDAREILKGDARVDLILPPRQEGGGRRKGRPVPRSTRWAIRCSTRCARCAAIWRRNRACRPM
jgi:hypothetical protein